MYRKISRLTAVHRGEKLYGCFFHSVLHGLRQNNLSYLDYLSWRMVCDLNWCIWRMRCFWCIFPDILSSPNIPDIPSILVLLWQMPGDWLRKRIIYHRKHGQDNVNQNEVMNFKTILENENSIMKLKVQNSHSQNQFVEACLLALCNKRVPSLSEF